MLMISRNALIGILAVVVVVAAGGLIVLSQAPDEPHISYNYTIDQVYSFEDYQGHTVTASTNVRYVCATVTLEAHGCGCSVPVNLATLKNDPIQRWTVDNAETVYFWANSAVSDSLADGESMTVTFIYGIYDEISKTAGFYLDLDEGKAGAKLVKDGKVSVPEFHAFKPTE